MKIGKKPILLIFAGLLTVLTLVQYRMDVRAAYLQSFEISSLKRERAIRALSGVVKSLVATGRRDLIEGHLQDALKVGWIEFYVITYRGEVVIYNSLRPLSDDAYSTLAALHPPEAFWRFESALEEERSIRGPASAEIKSLEDFRFLESDLGNGRRLKLGFNIDREAFLAEKEEYYGEENRRMLVLGLLISLGVFLFAARDIMKIASIVRKKGISGLKDVKTVSREAEALSEGLQGFGESVERLEVRNRKLSGQILPALRNEIDSGKKPPYDFNCSMVRTDINNFTKIFHTYPVDEFLATINEFFAECSHVISRYDGFIHEFVGDEIIFYFKDEHHSNSFTAALACAREIEAVADRIHRLTTEKNGYPFRVKSSVSYGRIRFGALLNGFSLAGAPLIETNRILGAVSERNENTIHFDSSNTVRLHGAVQFGEAFRTYLKGMDGERIIMRYIGHLNLNDLLGGLRAVAGATNEATSKFAILDDYRSDEELEKLLLSVGSASDAELSGQILRIMGKIRITKCDPKMTTMLVDVIRSLRDRGQRENRFSDLKALATLSGALPRLVPLENMNASVEPLLLELVDHSDLRVVANTIEALQALRDAGKVSKNLDRHLIDSRNPRVAANALVYLGTSEITADVTGRLREMILSAESPRVAAGIYAWGEISKFYIENDLVHLRTQTEFRALSELFIDALKRFPTATSQTREALRKAGETELLVTVDTRQSA